jgi:hypothetical protein
VWRHAQLRCCQQHCCSTSGETGPPTSEARLLMGGEAALEPAANYAIDDARATTTTTDYASCRTRFPCSDCVLMLLWTRRGLRAGTCWLRRWCWRCSCRSRWCR